jgi:hypothetical chaperone protein
VVLGRPVFFVDDDPARDAQAQAALEAAAAAWASTRCCSSSSPSPPRWTTSAGRRRAAVLVADIGGGTSDFSLVRVGPARRGRLDRRDDILASHGVHVAGTDFDRHVELAAILPLLGYRTLRRAAGEAEVPSGIYFDLATWHLINTVYARRAWPSCAQMRDWYADPAHHRRLMTVLQRAWAMRWRRRPSRPRSTSPPRAWRTSTCRGGAGLAATGSTSPPRPRAIEADLRAHREAARETLRLAGLAPATVDTLYFTGGSTGLAPLVAHRGRVPAPPAVVRGDRFASVAQAWACMRAGCS